MRIPELEGKNIAIVAMGESQLDFHLSLVHSKTYDEVWAINCMGAIINCDRVFMLDPASRFLDTEDAGTQTGIMRRWLPEAAVPIYTCELDERVPTSVLYPLEEVVQYSNCHYLNNTVAYAIAFAFWNEVANLKLFGIDFSYKENMHFAEAGRACVEFWISKCMSEDILIGISGRSTVLDSNVPATEKLYGFHRLNKPLVAVPHDGKFIIGPYQDINKQLEQYGLKIDEDVVPPEPYKG